MDMRLIAPVILGCLVTTNASAQLDLLCSVVWKGFNKQQVVVRIDDQTMTGSFEGEVVERVLVKDETFSLTLSCTPKPNDICMKTIVDINRFSGILTTFWSENLMVGADPEYEGFCEPLPERKF